LRLRQIKNDKFALRIRVHLPELRLPAAIDKSARIKIRHTDAANLFIKVPPDSAPTLLVAVAPRHSSISIYIYRGDGNGDGGRRNTQLLAAN